MSEPTKDDSGVPFGDIPEAIQRQRATTRALLAGARKNVKTGKVAKPARPVVTESAANPNDAPDTEVVPAAPKPAVGKWIRKTITLEHALISFELEILEHSVTNRFLTVIFEKSVKMPDPAEPTRFRLHIAGRTYSVEHMGINFEIPSLGLRGVSFLLVE